MRALVIIPTYNERENLPDLVASVLQHPRCSVLVVDDGSPDGTGEVAEALCARYPNRLSVVQRGKKQGLGSAYRVGFETGLTQGYDLLIEMDADFSHSPEHIPEFFDAVAAGADVVLGSRYVPGGGVDDWPVLRQAISRMGSFYARTVLGLPYRDLTGGFKCFRRSALERIDLKRLESNGFFFQVEMTYLCHKAGLRIDEIPIRFRDRQRGKSKMSQRILLEAAYMVLKLRLRQDLALLPARDEHRLLKERLR